MRPACSAVGAAVSRRAGRGILPAARRGTVGSSRGAMILPYASSSPSSPSSASFRSASSSTASATATGYRRRSESIGRKSRIFVDRRPPASSRSRPGDVGGGCVETVGGEEVNERRLHLDRLLEHDDHDPERACSWRDALAILDAAKAKARRSSSSSPPGAQDTDATADPNTAALSVEHYAAAVEICSFAWRGRECVGLLRDMVERGMAPTEKTYSDAIAACAEGGAWRDALGLLREMRDGRDLGQLERYACNYALKACGDAGRWEEARDLLGEMEERASSSSRTRTRTRPNVLTCNHRQGGDGPNIVSYNTVLGAYRRAGRWEEALELLRSMQASSSSSPRGTAVAVAVAPDVRSYTTVIAALGSANRWQRALDLMDSMGKNGDVQPDAGCYNAALAACTRSRRWEEALALSGRMMDANLQPDARTFRYVIEACGGAKQCDKALEVLRTVMPSRGVAADGGCYAAAVKACADAESWEKMRAVLGEAAAALLAEEDGDGKKSKDEAAAVWCYHEAISSSSRRADRLDDALGLLWEMNAARLLPLPKTYSAVMAACSRAGRNESAINVLREMEDRDKRGTIRHLSITEAYASAAAACANAGQAEQAERMVQKMLERGVDRNAYAYAAAMGSCGRVGLVDDALELLREMSQRGVDPNVRCYNSAVGACGRRGRWEEALGLLEEMKQMTGAHRSSEVIKPDAWTYAGAMAACTSGGRWRLALDLFDDMPNNGVTPDRACHNAAISACGKGRRWQRALEIFEAMKGRDDGRPSPDVVTYNATIVACGRSSQWKRALILLRTMIDNAKDDDDKNLAPRPDIVTFNSAIHACASAGQWEKAAYLLGEMLDRGLAPDAASYNSAIEACRNAGNWERALDLLHDMITRGVSPDATTYAAAIGACAGAGEWGRAQDLMTQSEGEGPGARLGTDQYTSALSQCRLREMESLGIAPSPLSYGAALASCGKSGEWEKALGVFRAMTDAAAAAKAGATDDNGGEDCHEIFAGPDASAYSAAITACFGAGQYGEALELLRGGRKAGHYPDSLDKRNAQESRLQSWDLRRFSLSESCLILADALLSLDSKADKPGKEEEKEEDGNFFPADVVVAPGAARKGRRGGSLDRLPPHFTLAEFLLDVSGPGAAQEDGGSGGHGNGVIGQRYRISHEALRSWRASPSSVGRFRDAFLCGKLIIPQ